MNPSLNQMNMENIKKFEKIPTKIFSDAVKASVEVAHEVANLIKTKQLENKPCVLGLATGSTPVKIYDELIRLHQEEGLSFKNVVTFNLDEYFPMQTDTLQSYHRFMKEHLFDHIDLLPENINIPDGTIAIEDVSAFCQNYEEKIEQYGGIDLQILGIGRTGHIGFNEPGSSINSLTRLITLDHLTITDAASDFYNEESVPRRAITMGVGSILKAKRVILLAWGEGKALILKPTVEGEIKDTIPATFLQKHKNANIYIDAAASAELTRVKTPWLVGSCNWDDRLIRQAVVWLCQRTAKPILKLTDRHYNENGMSDLVAKEGPSNKINIKVFNDLQNTITGWPGGKPNTDDSSRPERANPFPKKVLVFSPHPDDDVISMGGTLIRLVEQGHDVHTAYQTSGNIAVHDDDAIRFADFANEYNQSFNKNLSGKKDVFYENLLQFIKEKKPGQVDSDDLQYIKGLIRKGEAKAACRYVGIPEENITFLDMPFYETGTVKKKPISEADIQIIVDLLQKVKPHQVYAAGDLSDPHGTHRVCLSAIFEALERLKDEAWMKDCYVWLYRGAWQEWGINQVDMAVPISPLELKQKRKAIFKHQSQKDKALFPGADTREFWQRAEDRNRATAVLYDDLGMAEYEAIEVFVLYHLQ